MLENRAGNAPVSCPLFPLLLNARFPDYARFSSLERLGETLSSGILRIGLASPPDRAGCGVKVTFRLGVVGPARRAGFIR